ncbi:MAG TPA: allantoate amidohydrolase [Xanthobacteraceae bacterium]|nr:allantoate amidohydrolase [Xanthobacteraceae bacterium]
MVMEAESSVAAAGQDALGRRIIDLAARLAQWSETGDGLTCTYLTPPHRAAAAELRDLMRAAGMTAEIDGVGNVVGRYAAADPAAKTLIVASHYDTVVNAGSYDGRLGILTGLLAVEELHRSGRRLPFHVDVIGFAEEEGVRFAAHYLGSSAIAGRFDMRLLQHRDAGGQSVADVIYKAGFNPENIPSLARRPQDLLGYLEVHIEQGPVLLQEGLPVGIVTSIAGTARYNVSIAGMAGHAGTVPMPGRRDAAAAAAEIVLCVERRCAAAPTLVGTVGKLSVPGGAINVIPGRCELSLDIRAADDATRDAAVTDVLAEIGRIARRRNVSVEVKEIQRGPAVPCSPSLQARLAAAVERAGIVLRYLPSGAGHDAVSFSGVTDIAMLFVRCGNGGISHSPLETITAADADIATRILLDVLVNLGADHGVH